VLAAELSAAQAALDPSKVTPGIAGFLTVFVLAVATWLLIRSMTAHLRKVRYRAEQEEAETEAAAKAAARTAPRSAAKPKTKDRPAT
jgi:hypothetical protein